MAAEPDDVILRHRRAVLAILLADTTLGEFSEQELPAGADSHPRPTDPEADSESQAPPDISPPAPDSGSAGMARTRTAAPEPDLDAPTDPQVAERNPDPNTARPSAPAGGRASAQINALLNGRPQELSPTTAELLNNARGRIPVPAASEEPAASPDPASPRARGAGGPADRARAVLDRGRRFARTRTRTLLWIAATVVALVVLALVANPDPDRPSPPPLATAPATTSTAAPTGSTGAGGGLLRVRSAESRCPAGSTAAMDAFEGAPGKAWSCVRAYRVDGQVLRIDLGAVVTIESIGIVPGWDHVAADGTDQWTRFRTVSRVSYRFDDPGATIYTQETMDQRTLVVTRFEPPVQASRVVLTVLRSSGDPSINVTAISSVVITGR